MDYSQFIKKLPLPPEFAAPQRLRHEDVVATAISRADLEEDVRGINASLELIATTRGGGWPTEPVTEEFNYVDLVWHELEFRESASFAYVLRTPSLGYLGCCYLYPMGRRTALTEELLDYDVDASWWVTPDGYAAGYYAKVYRALQRWTVEEYPFRKVFFSNAELPTG